jgi:hypothetical protein
MLNSDRREATDTALDERVMSLLEAAAAPTEPGPLPGEAEALAAFRASQPTPRRSSMLSSVLSAKAGLAAALGTGVLLTGGVGMAAAGALPDGAQDTASEVLAKVGVTVPAAAQDAVAEAGNEGSTSDEEAGEGELPPAADKGQEIAELARSTELEGAEKGAAVSELASEGKSRAGEEKADNARSGADASDAGVDGRAVAEEKRAQSGENGDRAEGPGDRAATDAPNDGGTDTADGATSQKAGGSSASGTDTAGESSDGRSGAGSANRP